MKISDEVREFMSKIGRKGGKAGNRAQKKAAARLGGYARWGREAPPVGETDTLQNQAKALGTK